MQNQVPGQTHYGFVFQPLSIFPVISLIMVIDDGIRTIETLRIKSNTKQNNRIERVTLATVIDLFVFQVEKAGFLRHKMAMDYGNIRVYLYF